MIEIQILNERETFSLETYANSSAPIILRRSLIFCFVNGLKNCYRVYVFYQFDMGQLTSCYSWINTKTNQSDLVRTLDWRARSLNPKPFLCFNRTTENVSTVLRLTANFGWHFHNVQVCLAKNK